MQLRLRSAVAITLVAAAGALVACAKGESTDLGPAVAVTSKEPTEPPPESQKIPPKAPPAQGEPEEEEEDSGTGSSSGSSGGSSSGSSGSSGTSSGGTDAGTDSGKADSGKADSGTPDAAVDSGGPACATVAPSNACGLSPQCGCAANQTCDVTTPASGSVSCVLAGGGTLGTYCTSTTQCAKGFTCGYNTCRPYCPTIGAACTGAGLGQCTQYYVGGTPVTNSKVCTVSCDLRNPSAACGSNNCIFDTTINVTDCDKSGTKALYAPCTRYNECAQGLACADHPTFGFECEKWCRIGSNDCGIFESCEDVYGATAPTSAGVKLGHCQ